MLSLSLSELASLVLPGDLFMKPLAARVSSLVLWRVSLREDGGGLSPACVPPQCPPPRSTATSITFAACPCAQICAGPTGPAAVSRERRSWALPRSKETLDGFWGMCRRGSQALGRRWEETKRQESGECCRRANVRAQGAKSTTLGCGVPRWAAEALPKSFLSPSLHVMGQ